MVMWCPLFGSIFRSASHLHAETPVTACALSVTRDSSSLGHLKLTLQMHVEPRLACCTPQCYTVTLGRSIDRCRSKKDFATRTSRSPTDRNKSLKCKPAAATKSSPHNRGRAEQVGLQSHRLPRYGYYQGQTGADRRMKVLLLANQADHVLSS